MAIKTQIAVIGGGLAGKAAAVAGAKAGFEVFHVAPSSPPDRRTSALMRPSVDYLLRTGLIERPEELGVPLRRIRIIDATQRLLRALETVFDAQETGHEAFGWNLPNTSLNQSFARAAASFETLSSHEGSLISARREDGMWHIELDDGTNVVADLLVGADGKASKVRALAGITHRERKYRQAALVCDIELTRPLDGESVEFHYPDGPFTLVPAGGRKANLVWIDKQDILETAHGDEGTLLAALMEKSQRIFGPITVLSPSFVFPLSSLSVEVAGRNAAVLVGESAHAFPPIGAQGLNLGLRDIADLDAALAAANPGAYGWADAVSRCYAAERRGDLARTGGFVDGLFTSLLSPHLPAQLLRTVGLWGLRTSPALRRQAVKFGMGQ